MSDTVDLGIDLGTTNSAIAVIEAGRAEVLRDNFDDSELLPSCVSVDMDGNLRLGRQAQNELLTSPERAFEGFKRFMGKERPYTTPEGRVFQPQDLSAEILKELRNRASQWLNSSPSEAVITVPAAFGEVEKHAVILAGRSAGFQIVTLIQEPVAAGLAYGWEREADSKPFLVYDLGGGTFDASVLRSVAGQLLVLGHLGNHTEGGRDMDDAIRDELLRPALKTPLDSNEGNLRAASKVCEEAKIRLSNPGIDSSIMALSGLSDVNGQPVQETMSLSRVAFEQLIDGQIDRTIEVVQKLLKDVQVSETDLEAIILVGGPTRIPYLRRKLQEAFGAQIQTRINPMTVVAQGAALFAASILKTSDTPQFTSGPSDGLNLRLAYEPVANQALVPVGVALERGGEGLVRFRRNDGLWDSGLVQLVNGQAMIQVSLGEEPVSSFVIELFDNNGSVVAANPNEFRITRGLAAAPPPLSRAIGVIGEDPFGGSGSMKVQILAERGKPTPLTRRERYVTTRALVPGSEEAALRIGFFEGPATTLDAFAPERCRHIGSVVVKGSDIDRPLPSGTDIEVSLRIDASSEALGRVYIPVLKKTLEANLFDFDVSAMPTPEDLESRVEQVEGRLAEMESAGVNTHSLREKVESARTAVLAIYSSGDDGIARADARLEEVELEADDIESREAPKLALQELSELQEVTRSIVEAYGEAEHIRRFDQLDAEADKVIENEDSAGARSVRQRLFDLAVGIYWNQPGAWVSKFQNLASSQGFTNPQEAQSLLDRGRQALESGDLELLKTVVLQLMSLTPSDEQAGRWDVFAGIAKKQ